MTMGDVLVSQRWQSSTN